MESQSYVVQQHLMAVSYMLAAAAAAVAGMLML